MSYQIGDRKKLKLEICELIAKKYLSRGFNLSELHKSDFDELFNIASQVLAIRDRYIEKV